MQQPNILYLHTHDAGRYIQPYGHKCETPNLQHLAEEGVLFRKAFCANPTCSPSRAALLTGEYPHQNGMHGLAHRGWRLNDYKRHIINVLKPHGYISVLAGIQHIASKPFAAKEEIGYDRILTTDGGFTAPTDAAIKFLNKAPDSPFFLTVGYHAPHRAGDVFNTIHPPADARYVQPPDPLPDVPETRADMALFDASIKGTDASMGRVLHALERNGLADNTLVICTTDHGIAFPGMKCNLTDHGIGVMLIMRGPGGFTGGTVVDGLVSHVDIFPTICDVVGVSAPEWLEGISMCPLVDGSCDSIRDTVFAEVNYHASYEPQRCIRTKRWKYIRRFEHRDRPILANCDNSISKKVWHENGWLDDGYDEELLFDLAFDPTEACNRVTDPNCRDVLSTLRTQLQEWMKRTKDPLLQGPVAAPPNAVVTDPDAYGPRDGLESS